MSIRQIILIHVRASGPVSFRSICAYVAQQWSAPAEDFHVAEVLTSLIRDGHIKLYDDGESFTAAL